MVDPEAKESEETGQICQIRSILIYAKGER